MILRCILNLSIFSHSFTFLTFLKFFLNVFTSMMISRSRSLAGLRVLLRKEGKIEPKWWDLRPWSNSENRLKCFMSSYSFHGRPRERYSRLGFQWRAVLLHMTSDSYGRTMRVSSRSLKSNLQPYLCSLKAPKNSPRAKGWETEEGVGGIGEVERQGAEWL